MKKIEDNTIEQLMERPYWIVDVLPKQVPLGSRGQYFTVEKYLLDRQRRAALGEKQADILIKLNCYEDLDVSTDCDHWQHNPAPEELSLLVHDCITGNQPLYILMAEGETLLTLSGDVTYMTLYNPNADVLELVCALASAQGLFVWPIITD